MLTCTSVTDFDLRFKLDKHPRPCFEHLDRYAVSAHNLHELRCSSSLVTITDFTDLCPSRFSMSELEGVLIDNWMCIRIIFGWKRCLTLYFKGILSTTIVIFSYPKLLSLSVLTFIKWRLKHRIIGATANYCQWLA
jgi:hypothetical protein